MFLAAGSLIILSALSPCITRYCQEKVDRFDPIFEWASKKHDVPKWVLIGIAVQESNITPSAKSSTHDWGVMQIHCNKRGWSWLPYLKKRGLKLKKCKDLLDPKKNIEAGAIIVRYLMYFGGEKRGFVDTMTLYNCGPRCKTPRKKYAAKVKFYGQKSQKEKVKWRARHVL